MLKKILSYSDCNNCRFCCSFRRCSLWETPLFPLETANKLKYGNEFSFTEVNGYECARMNLDNKYKSEDSEEEAPCHFLEKDNGCTLSEEDKPFDCKIWPLRVMKKNSRLVIALTPTCPVINKIDFDYIKTFVRQELSEKIFRYAESHPYIIKEYKQNFPIIDIKE